MPTLRLLVHVTPESFAVDMVGVFVRVPVDGVIGVRHAVGSDVAPAIALTSGHQARDRCGGTQVELQPLVV